MSTTVADYGTCPICKGKDTLSILNPYVRTSHVRCLSCRWDSPVARTETGHVVPAQFVAVIRSAGKSRKVWQADRFTGALMLTTNRAPVRDRVVLSGPTVSVYHAAVAEAARLYVKTGCSRAAVLEPEIVAGQPVESFRSGSIRTRVVAL